MEARPVWADVSLKQIQKNLRIVRRYVGRGHQILAIVKGNAYGHGSPAVARALAKAGAEWLGVTSVGEALELREAHIRQPILLLTGFFPGEESEIVRHRLTPSITRLEQINTLDRIAKRASRHLAFHLKLDTGMGRLGLPCRDIPAFLETLGQANHVSLEGVFTHFASAEDLTSSQTQQQLACFRTALQQIEAAGLRPRYVHAANSAGIALWPESWGNMVRPGILLYGHLPFITVAEGRDRTALDRSLPVAPALSLRARIISLKDFPAGAVLGYGARFRTARPSRIAVIPVGYADGLPRALTNRASVIVRRKFAPVVGTISMDLAIVDVTDVAGVRLDEEVTILGSSGSLTIRITDWARELNTVASDLYCQIGARVRRRYH